MTSTSATLTKLLMITCVICSFACTGKQIEEKPNIIFLLADDQSYNTVHAMGNQEIITPNLDKLVQSGVTFTHAYNMGAWHGAVCVASRTMFNTGRSVWRARDAERLLTQQDSLLTAQLWGNTMKQAGYDTYMAGKWHVKTRVDSCFQFIGTKRPGLPNQTPEGYNRPLHEQDTTWLPWHTHYAGFWKGGKHWSEVLGDEAIGFIQQAQTRTNPFFMYIAFNAPHDPRQSPKEFVDLYPLENIQVPFTFLDEYPEKEAMGCGKKLRDEKLAPFPRTEYAVKVNRQEYYAIITHLDQQIGRILDALEASGQKENTYIFYTADHGLACGNHGLMGKQNMYDHSMRAPLIVIGPDLPRNKKIDLDVYIQDIMPSTLELAGVTKPQYVEFSSLMPMIRQTQTHSAYPAIYGAYKDQQRMIRADGYKLIVYPDAPKVKLFNLVDDPQEMKNLADLDQYQTKVQELLGQLLQLQTEMGDELDLKAFFTF